MENRLNKTNNLNFKSFKMIVFIKYPKKKILWYRAADYLQKGREIMITPAVDRLIIQTHYRIINITHTWTKLI